MLVYRYKRKKEVENMFKKVLSTLAAAAFVFGAFSKISVLPNVANACSSVCCAHNGDMWDN